MAKTKEVAAKKPVPKTAKAEKTAKVAQATKIEGAQVVAKGYVPSLQKKYKEEIAY